MLNSNWKSINPATRNFLSKSLVKWLEKNLEWIRYEQLMPYVQPDGKAFVVIVGDFVTTEEGTGIVHTASFLVQMISECARQKALLLFW